MNSFNCLGETLPLLPSLSGLCSADTVLLRTQYNHATSIHHDQTQGAVMTATDKGVKSQDTHDLDPSYMRTRAVGANLAIPSR